MGKIQHMLAIFQVAACLCFGAGIAEAQTAAAEQPGAAADLKPMSDAEMVAQTGGEEPLSISLASNQSSVTGNQIGGVGATGGVGSSNLSNNSGLTTLISNTGNQVVISQSTIVNVFLH